MTITIQIHKILYKYTLYFNYLLMDSFFLLWLFDKRWVFNKSPVGLNHILILPILINIACLIYIVVDQDGKVCK
jgi:hypothetical protein